MSDSRVSFEFGPMPPERAERLLELQDIYDSNGEFDEFEEFIFNAFYDELTEDEGQIKIVIWEASQGGGESILEAALWLQEHDIPYSIHDSGCSGSWDPELTYWRPGMPEPISQLIMTGQGEEGTEIVIPASKLIELLQDYPEALAKVEDYFKLGGLSI